MNQPATQPSSAPKPLTVQELIDILSGFDETLPVYLDGRPAIGVKQKPGATSAPDLPHPISPTKST